MNSDNNQTLENTRRLAQEAMERASNTVNSLRSGVSDRAAAAQRYVGQYAVASKTYVSDHPLKSALIAAAIGAAVAGLVLALRHRRDNDKYF
jgi:ElaB/YqjD/DUF883 family membrane-anchored ribosome-binding protein